MHLEDLQISMSQESLSKPFLPAAFLKNLRADPMMTGYTSLSFTPEGHSRRTGLIGSAQGATRFAVVIAPDPQDSKAAAPLIDAGFTQLHIVAADGDPVWACELIRLGCPVDAKSDRGKTPLRAALDGIFLHHYLGQRRSPTERTAEAERCLFIARTLIEQHADVNIVVDGRSPLLDACILTRHGYGDLVILLLQHGADASQLPASIPLSLKHFVTGPVFSTAAARSGFITTAKGFLKLNRPARQCPCFSGQTLADCHANVAMVIHFAPNFLCICGSGKTYRRCCARRLIGLQEKWSEKQQRILVTASLGPPSETVYADSTQSADADTASGPKPDLKEESTARVDGGTKLDLRGWSEARLSMYRRFADEMCTRGLLDLAFAPSNRHRVLGKHTFGLMQAAWNTKIDEYIGLGTDPRPSVEIERAAKIGLYHGALHRTCDGPLCAKLEGRDIAKLSMCSKCNIALYCSKPCQTAAWRDHKRQCASANQVEQALPAQRAFDNYVQRKVANFLARPQYALQELGPELYQRFLDVSKGPTLPCGGIEEYVM
ncbi:hypothetical protein PLICRDRAFT_700785 [Plicaturopsis crispa FD-325 SS-3]|nr:hypothetical protein PLICRDRAFT_700785 [Plicaturopsis crispa FD-325 SS-3]